MNLDHWKPTLALHPMVEEANIWDLSEGKILADSVLRRHVVYLERISPRGSLIQEYARWLLEVFPELLTAPDIPDIWRWSDLVTDVRNVGDVKQARVKCDEWVEEGKRVAYWTGGLEFTRSHYEVAGYLLDKEYTVLLGIEPSCYPWEVDKLRGVIAVNSVPVSLWSKCLKESGFVFVVPRPLPEGREERNSFYAKLFDQVTGGKARIVVTERDVYKEEKLARGEIVEVPCFEFSSTTELWESYYRY